MKTAILILSMLHGGDLLYETSAVEDVARSASTQEESVTVRIWDRRGRSSYGGSGVIVHKALGKAIILSCYHTHDGGGSDIEVSGHGYKSKAKLIAANPQEDLVFLLVDDAPGMPMAPVSYREIRRGDRVTLTGFGSATRGLMSRVGIAVDNCHTIGRTDHGDSGGPCFNNGFVAGICVTSTDPGNSGATTGLVPLRKIYVFAGELARASGQARVEMGVMGGRRRGFYVDTSQSTEECGLLPFIGRAIFNNHDKKRGIYPYGRSCPDGRCGPGNGSPGIDWGQSPGGSPDADGPENGGEPWVAPGIGLGQGEDSSGGLLFGDSQRKGKPKGEEGKSIDLSGYAKKEDIDSSIKPVIERLDGFEKLLAKDRSEIVSGFKDINAKISAIKPCTCAPPLPPNIVVKYRVAGNSDSLNWNRLKGFVDNAREAGVMIGLYDVKYSNLKFPSQHIPCLIEYGDSNAHLAEPIYGQWAVEAKLQSLARRP